MMEPAAIIGERIDQRRIAQDIGEGSALPRRGSAKGAPLPGRIARRYHIGKERQSQERDAERDQKGGIDAKDAAYVELGKMHFASMEVRQRENKPAQHEEQNDGR